MNKTVNARHDADESAELGDGNDGSGELGADGNLILQLDPGVVLFLLVAQGDLLVLGIVALDVDFDLIADVDDLGGMLDVVPAQLADVAQAIDAADVNESAVRGQALDNALILLADLNIAQNSSRLALLASAVTLLMEPTILRPAHSVMTN